MKLSGGQNPGVGDAEGAFHGLDAGISPYEERAGRFWLRQAAGDGRRPAAGDEFVRDVLTGKIEGPADPAHRRPAEQGLDAEPANRSLDEDADVAEAGLQPAQYGSARIGERDNGPNHASFFNAIFPSFTTSMTGSTPGAATMSRSPRIS